MGTVAGVGYSTHRNPAVAGKEAASKALKQAEIDVPDFVMVFATVGYNQEALIESIREATSEAPLSGCSGEGVITHQTGDETNFGVTVMVVKSDDMRFEHEYIEDISKKADMAGRNLADKIKPYLSQDNIACFIFADGLVFNSNPFMEAFETTIEKPLPIFGGLAADNWASEKTYQYHNDKVFSEGISCVLMSGRGNIAWGINHGCVPVGTKRTITKSKDNIIYEFDGVPALTALRDYSDDDWETQWNKTSLNLCLGFRTPERYKEDYEDHIIRYMIRKDDSAGSVQIQSEVRDGDELWIVRRDKELIRNGMQQISRQIKTKIGSTKPKFIMHIECVGRGKVVFREHEKMDLISSLQKDLGEDIPWIGFYSFGEIGPIAKSNCFHNFTAVVVAVYEAGSSEECLDTETAA
jgi:hypothetical protein